MDKGKSSSHVESNDHEDSWEDNSWDRDDWKNEDWGVPPTESQQANPSEKISGIESYQKGMLEAGPYLTLGLQIAFGMLFFVALGYFADGFLSIRPWGMVIGACMGMVGVFYLIIRLAKQAEEDKRSEGK